MRNISGHGVIPPLEIIRSDNLLDLRVYLECAILCPQNGSPFDLPPREILAEVCCTSLPSLSQSLQRLCRTEYFKIVNPPNGKTTRRRVVMKVIRVGEILNVHEGFIDSNSYDSRNKWMMKIQKENEDVKSTLHKIYSKPTQSFSPSPELTELHSKCKNRDVNDHTLAVYPLYDLHTAAGFPTENDLAIAIKETEGFKPRSGVIANIFECFRSRFKKNDEFQCTGKLNDKRQNRLQESPLPKIRDAILRKEKTEEQILLCPIHPTDIFSKETIDRKCELLNDGYRVLRGELPLYFLELPCIELFDNEAKLAKGVEKLVKVAAGYWIPVWEQTTKAAATCVTVQASNN